MNRFLSPDSFVGKALARIADLVILNVMWIIGCLPVFTIGTSTAALYASLKALRIDTTVSAKYFWREYRRNFKQGTILWGILVGCAGLLAVDLYILIALDLKMRFALIVVLLVMAAVYVAAAGYIFPIQGCFDNSVVNILKNSVILAVLHFPKTILITATNMAPFWLFAVAPDAVWMTLPFWFAIGGASVAYLNSILLQSVFARYTDESPVRTE